jgi:hypothetical protein
MSDILEPGEVDPSSNKEKEEENISKDPLDELTKLSQEMGLYE